MLILWMSVNDQGEVKHKLQWMNMSRNKMDNLKVQGPAFRSLTFQLPSPTQVPVLVKWC